MNLRRFIYLYIRYIFYTNIHPKQTIRAIKPLWNNEWDLQKWIKTAITSALENPICLCFSRMSPVSWCSVKRWRTKKYHQRDARTKCTRHETNPLQIYIYALCMMILIFDFVDKYLTFWNYMTQPKFESEYHSLKSTFKRNSNLRQTHQHQKATEIISSILTQSTECKKNERATVINTYMNWQSWMRMHLIYSISKRLIFHPCWHVGQNRGHLKKQKSVKIINRDNCISGKWENEKKIDFGF